MSVRNASATALSARGTAAQAGHLGGQACLVDEDKAPGIEIGLSLEPIPAPLQEVGALLLQCMGGLFFERPAPPAKPGAQRAATNGDGVFGQEPCRHLVQRDVSPLLDQCDDLGFMDIKARAASATLRAGRSLACPGPGNPSDRSRDSDAEPGRRPSGRQSLRRSLQHAYAKIITQSSRHPSPPSIGRLNQPDTNSSHHKRFNVLRKRSSAPSDRRYPTISRSSRRWRPVAGRRALNFFAPAASCSWALSR